MKLGTETGSVMNAIYSRMVGPVPNVGDGATVCFWTDRTAGTVIEVRHTKSSVFVTVQEDKCTREDNNGMSESQTYTYEPNTNGRTWTFRSMHGKPYRVSAKGGPGVYFGDRRAYHDYSY